MSAYSGPLLTQQALAAGVSELLTKPVQSREIATTLARVLHLVAYLSRRLVEPDPANLLRHV
ncbi:MAG TPA: hypothetical protein VGG82_04630 [Casimicrobiaceae bacterium]